MKQKLAWTGIVLVPTVVLGGMWLARRNLSKPNWVLPTQMADSAAYKSQTANPVLPGRMTMQQPVDATLARGTQPFHYGAGDAERKRAGRELRNPFRATPETLRRGKQVYETFCLVCHGAAGHGDGPLVPRFPNPPSFLAASSRQFTDGEMFHILTRGRNKMPSHASQVGPEDRWRVILYVRSLQKGTP